MRTAGHTILQATKEAGHFLDVTLECSCGRVFSSGRCVRAKEQKMRGLVFEDGRDAAALHIARVQEAVKTLTAERPCAA